LKFISVDDYILQAMNLYGYPLDSGLYEAHSQSNLLTKSTPVQAGVDFGNA